MWSQRIFGVLALGCILHLSPVTGLWSCNSDLDCGSLSGGICRNGDCACPLGKQPVLGGSVCVDVAPYHTSPCVESHQCSRMSLAFECRRNNVTDETGNCFCQANHHYFLGRCWPTADYGSPCSRSEECLSSIRDPFSLACRETCQCADGYYERQRGECRKIGQAVGDGCVLDVDCHFEGGACDLRNFVCYDRNAETRTEDTSPTANVTKSTLSAISRQHGAECNANVPCPDPLECSNFGFCLCPVGYYASDDGSVCFAETRTEDTSPTANVTKSTLSAISRQHGAECNANVPCPDPLECSNFGFCLCPVGYYASDDGSVCFAELGSPSSEERCAGLLAVVHDGICTCPPNFFFEENMRDCTKVARTLTDACVSDSSCHTFGAASVCGEEQPPWGMRRCECLTELAVWDDSLQMCRLFAGIGESCQADADCLAGDLEIQCVVDAGGQGVCTCPDGYLAVDGLCLTTGLELGATCQSTQECTGTANTVCEDSVCSCDSSGYQEVDGICAPIIGGVCQQDSDCVITNTSCTNTAAGLTCQCDHGFIVYDDACWPTISELDSCSVSAQCHQLLGAASSCSEDRCQCDAGFHQRDGGCWPVTALFEPCSRTSQCYLASVSERVVCRNSLCQCDFRYPYSEQLLTCTSSATRAIISIFLLALTCIIL